MNNPEPIRGEKENSDVALKLFIIITLAGAVIIGAIAYSLSGNSSDIFTSAVFVAFLGGFVWFYDKLVG